MTILASPTRSLSRWLPRDAVVLALFPREEGLAIRAMLLPDVKSILCQPTALSTGHLNRPSLPLIVLPSPPQGGAAILPLLARCQRANPASSFAIAVPLWHDRGRHLMDLVLAGAYALDGGTPERIAESVRAVLAAAITHDSPVPGQHTELDETRVRLHAELALILRHDESRKAVIAGINGDDPTGAVRSTTGAARHSGFELELYRWGRVLRAAMLIESGVAIEAAAHASGFPSRRALRATGHRLFARTRLPFRLRTTDILAALGRRAARQHLSLA
ncbi:MAG: hypothetical protein ABJE47_12840 [bacterium]